jgi:hypothetical protein
MKYQTIAPHRRLVTKFAAMAVFLSLIPQVVIYLLSARLPDHFECALGDPENQP